ncbi:2-iminoacetate synthase ThiH [Desulfosporosinus sp. BICA1-9]|uniref:2-iminoacetate synthase ThiH n=1 Tax=Desulfosporosinus sp. BICA1-9 TaxID=1531958 RepID=UPI00054C74F9|nr:2-iminoacetate synthase ThiH [Desulfosporosinus sp. BICA1-9]KJS49502.1 MAG: thiamine biosynthesis protein ThiH [Peptococcaceae bacterium BRH_c23]KJS85241.1 MAG: thiamine biosynthesis protein ThiH [Desulfosporosinus sp. BICA1-9]HBW37474.1 2-iminoacetate synthase ThiH [Desulfosporosinus sp.]
MFYEQKTEWQQRLPESIWTSYSRVDVERVLARETVLPEDLAILLSPAAQPYLEPMAKKAQALTIRHFGRTIGLFTPLYLANFCSNSCLYCSFHAGNEIVRCKLSVEQAIKEGEAISSTGLQHLLLLTGESRSQSGPAYIEQCVRALRPMFASLGLEVYPLSTEEYRRLYEAGVDSVTLFQETYQESTYALVHPSGPKRDYHYRLEAPERACSAGISSINIGALLGISDWRRDAFYSALHADYLQRKYPGVEVAISVPRLRPYAGSFSSFATPVTDAALVQIILAYRLFLPRAGLTLSTRESPQMRENLLPLGITRISAGALTSVGGYSETDNVGSAQFEIADERSVPEVVQMIRAKGYLPAFCDWVNMRERNAVAQ